LDWVFSVANFELASLAEFKLDPSPVLFNCEKLGWSDNSNSDFFNREFI
jgi:hypothetical protein